MTKHTTRDDVWHKALKFAISEECFKLERIRDTIKTDVSDRTIRDTLNTMVDHGWLSKQSPRSHTWEPGPLSRGEDKKEYSQDPSVINVTNASSISQGPVYVGEVDRISGSGNAMISTEEKEINLGPIDREALGERVKFRYVGGVWGKCLTEKYTYEGYSPRDGRSKSSSSSTTPARQGFTARGAKSSGNGTITSKDPANKNKLLKGKK